MIYALAVGVALWGGLEVKAGGIGFRLSEGVVVRFVPDSARLHVYPLLRMHPRGGLRFVSGTPWGGTEIGDAFLAGHPDGTPREIDIGFRDQSKTGPGAILYALSVVKQHAESAATRCQIGRPNVVIYLRFQKPHLLP
jgi:hypothetical protein